MNAVDDIIDVPTAGEVLASLELIVTSPGFRRSPQLVAFLRFVVESTLRDKDGHIKSYTIGTQALGRGENFDPQIDPIVRVEAGRLRRALAIYYASEGVRRSVTIEIPLGSYVPRFRHSKKHRPIEVLSAILRQTLSFVRTPSRKKRFLAPEWISRRLL